MPDSFDMNLEKIGKGKPALVFVYDPNLTLSIDQSDEMNKARVQLGDQISFLIASIGTPQGDQFIQKFQSRPAELFLFDSTGKLIKRELALIPSDELIKWFTVSSTPVKH